MNKMPRLSKSGIEYLDCAWNFYSGCQNSERGICSVGKLCWARKITERFKNHYPNGFEPTFYPEAFLSPLHLKKPSIIGVAFMGDLFGDWVDPDKKFHSVMPSGKASVTMSLKGWIFTTIEQCPQHTFLFKTKCPWNLPKWSPFPENCFVGVTATDRIQFNMAAGALAQIQAKVKYISFEPLLDRIGMDSIPVYLTSLFKEGWLQWVILGACTGRKQELWQLVKYPNAPDLKPWANKWTLQPPISWVAEIVEAADKAGVKVFLKNNLEPLFLKEFPPRPFENFGCWNLPDWVMDKEAKSKGLLKLRQEIPVVL